MQKNSSKNWHSKVKEKNDRLYHLSQTFSDGRVAYYYVLIDPPKEAAFLKEFKSKKGTFELTSYGKLVASGWGTPPVALAQEMQRTYALKASM
ncbi:MAG: hypothetical protein SFW64_02305 [Alphaproteobacteria bacterium]|nr:hypothetical protein [Alphaproteobacteria bacterium]